MKKTSRWLLIGVGILALSACAFFPWLYTSASRDGSRPYVWYVIAEVRASSRADGFPLGHNGCDAPGSFFLQTKQGWVYVPEGAFPGWMSNWMGVFDMAGPGQSTPSTDWAPGQPGRFCL